MTRWTVIYALAGLGGIAGLLWWWSAWTDRSLFIRSDAEWMSPTWRKAQERRATRIQFDGVVWDWPVKDYGRR